MTKIFTHSLPDAHPKHWQLLSEHAKQVALLAKGFAGKFGAASLGGVAGSLHDVGKYSDEFLRKLHGASAAARPLTRGRELKLGQSNLAPTNEGSA